MDTVKEVIFADKCYSVAFSPIIDQEPCTYMAVGLEKSIALCDPVSGRILHTLDGHEHIVYSVSFSPCVASNGRQLLASASGDGTVRLWDTESKQCENILHQHPVSCHMYAPHSCGKRTWHPKCPHVLFISVAFSNDGSLLASGSDDCVVRLWDVATRSDGPVLMGHTQWVFAIAFSSNDRLLASTSMDRTMRLWNMPDGKPGPVINCHEGAIFWGVAFSPVAETNILALSCRDGVLQLWDVSGSGQLVRELKGHSGVWSVAFSPDGSQLASGLEDCTIRLWSVATGALLKALEGHSDSAECVAFHPSGHQLASASGDRMVRIWTICEWSDRLHHLFGPELKRMVFVLMCVKKRQEDKDVGCKLSMPLWLRLFQSLAILIV